MHFHYQFEDIGVDQGTRSFSFPFMPFYSLFALPFNILYVKVVANPSSASKHMIMSRGYHLCRTLQALISEHQSLKVLIHVKPFAWVQQWRWLHQTYQLQQQTALSK